MRTSLDSVVWKVNTSVAPAVAGFSILVRLKDISPDAKLVPPERIRVTVSEEDVKLSVPSIPMIL